MGSSTKASFGEPLSASRRCAGCAGRYSSRDRHARRAHDHGQRREPTQREESAGGHENRRTRSATRGAGQSGGHAVSAQMDCWATSFRPANILSVARESQELPVKRRSLCPASRFPRRTSRNPRARVGCGRRRHFWRPQPPERDAGRASVECGRGRLAARLDIPPSRWAPRPVAPPVSSQGLCAVRKALSAHVCVIDTESV